MKKYLLTLIILGCFASTRAQLPEDVLRYSFTPQNGSARFMAIGGAMGSLGGDISALYTNPAGLGLYKTREFVLSPGANLNNNKFNFRGTELSDKKSAFNFGTSGFVIGYNTPNSKWTSQAISFGVNATANFNNILHYKGQNNLSSYTEYFTEEISNSGLSLDQVINNSAYAFGSSPAINTYLVDTFRNASSNLVQLKGLPEFLLEKGIALNQEKTIDTRGGIYEFALGYAANMDDKLYLGGTLGVPVVSYSRKTTYLESDPTNDKTNNFNYFQLNDNLSTKGVGVNLKLGLIYKPSEFVRLGFNVHSPTFYSLIDRQSSDITADTEGYNQVASSKSSEFTNGLEGLTKYAMTSPWKANLSGSYVFREINDTRKQRAFITADVEVVGYRNSHFSADAETATSADEQYYSDMKTVIKRIYKNAMNFRLGGELKFHTWMVRAGTAYYGNPYEDAALKANRFIASGGLGYRNHGLFIDLTYAHSFNRDINFPYRLVSQSNTYAEQSGSTGNVMLTLGFKL